MLIMEKIDAIVNLLVNNGMAVVVVGYFLYRDNKYNEETIVLLNSIKNVVESLQDMISKVGVSNDD